MKNDQTPQTTEFDAGWNAAIKAIHQVVGEAASGKGPLWLVDGLSDELNGGRRARPIAERDMGDATMTDAPVTTLPADWRITEIRIEAACDTEVLSRGSQDRNGLDPNVEFAQMLADVIKTMERRNQTNQERANAKTNP